MAIQPERLLAHTFGETRQRYDERDAILYALGLGLGRDEVDRTDPCFLDETRGKVVPTFAVTLGSPGMWIRDPVFGVDFGRLVHSEQAAEFHAPLPPSGEVSATARVISLHDRGAGRGAVLALERRIVDASTGVPYCTLVQTLLLRGDGGFGGPPAPRQSSPIPDTQAVVTARVTLSERAALIYRLSGDRNPLHVDPVFARRAGFDRPIMHGLGTYGTVGVAVARALGGSPDQLTSLACRFSGVVLPGDTLAIEIWGAPANAVFRASVGDRLVIDAGRLTMKE